MSDSSATPMVAPETLGATMPDSAATVPQAFRSVVAGPFDTIPKPSGGLVEDKDLLAFHRTHMVDRYFPIFSCTKLAKAWRDEFRVDPLLTQIAMATTSHYLKLGHRESELMIDSYELLQESIDRVEWDEVVPDRVVLGIGALLALELDRWQVTKILLLIQGLRNKIDARGGLDNLSILSPMTASFVFWVTMVTRISSDADPIRFESQQDFQLDEEPSSMTETYPAIRLRAPSMRTPRAVLGPYMFTLMGDTEEAYHGLQRLKTVKKTTEANRIVLDFCYALQKLVDTDFTKLPSSRNPQPQLSECSRFAAALYLLQPCQQLYPSPVLLTNSVLHRLEVSLAAATELPIDEDNRSEGAHLVWAAYMGCASSVHQPKLHAWFVQQVHSLLGQMDEMDVTGPKISTKAELGATLNTVMESGMIDEQVLNSVWLDIHIDSLQLI